MDDYDLTDNVFCTAILQILKMPDFLKEPSPIIDLDALKCDFESNGNCDETFYDNDCTRKPFAPLPNLQTNKNLSRKAMKMAQKGQTSSCRFCENNQESAEVCNSHVLRDHMGKLKCPRLRKYVCPICRATGDDAHTVRYCKKRPIFIIKGDETTEVKRVRAHTLKKKTIRV